MNPLSNFKVKLFVKLAASGLCCFNTHWHFLRADPSGLQQKVCFYTPQFSITCTQTYHRTERTPFANTTYLSIYIFNFVAEQKRQLLTDNLCIKVVTVGIFGKYFLRHRFTQLHSTFATFYNG